MRPLVSAIITTHNRLPLLKRAIDSVLSQTYNNIECIVVSDNCTDGTVEFCSRIDKIRLIEINQSESKGGNHARNVGILAANGKYVAFLDDDDYWLPTKIQRQISYADITGSPFIFCRRHYEVIGENGMVENEFEDGPLLEGDLHKQVLLTCCITTSSTMLVKKDTLVEVGMFDEQLSFWQDYELSIRLAQCTQMCCVQEPLTVYRINKFDANRLTNKYYDWKLAVDYIHKKHTDLYAALSLCEKRKVKVITLKDAKERALVSRLEREYKKILHKLYIFALPEIITNKICRIFSSTHD